MRTLYIVPGHSNVPTKDRGAVAKHYGITYYEGDLAADAAITLINRLKFHGVDNVKTDSTSNVLKETLAWLRTLTLKPNDIAIEFHFNASDNEQATGTECVIPDKYTTFERDIAANIAKIISDNLGIKNRGVINEGNTPRKRLGWFTAPCENVIVEICFISNTNDVIQYQKCFFYAANGIAKYLKTLI